MRKRRLYLHLGVLVFTVASLSACSMTRPDNKESVAVTETEALPEPPIETLAEVETDTSKSIDEVLATFDWGEKAVYLPAVEETLEAEGIHYKGVYNYSGERLDVVLPDGIKLIFLATQNMEGQEYGYELMMCNDQFNENGFQENYLNHYDVTMDQEYYPETRIEIDDSIKDLIGRNQTNLSIARNELFARHGRVFQDPFLDAVFRRKSWYQPTYNGDEFLENQSELLSAVEMENIQTIIEMEQSYGYRLPDGVSANRPECILSGSYLDLDGDGTAEKVTYEKVVSVEFQEESYTLLVDDSKKTSQGFNLYEDLYVASLDGKTTQLLAAAAGPSADYTMDIYRYEDGMLQLIGQLPGDPDTMYIEANWFSTTSQHDFFQTWNTRESYEIQSGTIQRIDAGWYGFGNEARAIAEIPLYKERGGTQIAVTLHPGDEVIIVGTDYKEWVCIEKKDSGEQGWLRCYGENGVGYGCILPDGKEAASYELFDGLSFYG